MPKGGKVTPLRSLADRISGAFKGARDGWFGPGEPLEVLAPASVRGRQFDFPTAFNLSTQPRSEQGESGIGFADLRALADPPSGGLDLLRIAIEKRKNQMESQRWSIRGRAKPGQKPDDGGDKARGIEQELRFPDGVHTFSQWQRMLVEDLLVIDAPTLYLAPSLKGHLIPQVMDGALLKPLLQEDGRTPLPPAPAFQQILKGVPAADYTLDEVVRTPRNLRSYRVYGMSPVEQVIMTVSIALRRQLSQLEYYTAGSVPDMVFGVPPEWSPDHIKQFQEYWDTVMSGNTAERRRVRFVPGGMDPHELKAQMLQDSFDEWLSRIICFCFDLSPQALVKEVNRATAQTSKNSSQEEGLEPMKLWFKDTVDAVLMKAFDATDLEFAYADEEIVDPEVKSKVIVALAGGKPLITQDEGREKFGLPPMTAAQREELQPPAPMLDAGAAPGDKPAEKPTNGATKKPGALQQPSAEKVLKGRHVRFVRDEKGTIVGADLD